MTAASWMNVRKGCSKNGQNTPKFSASHNTEIETAAKSVAKTRKRLLKGWKKFAAAEEVSVMLKRLISLEVTTEDLDNILDNQQNCRKSKKKGRGTREGERDRKKGAKVLMEGKINDNKQVELEELRERNSVRNELEKKMGGPKVNQYRKMIREIKSEVKKHRKKVRKKLEEKTEHLFESQKPAEEVLPETLRRYGAAGIFQKECLLAAQKLSGLG